LKSIHLQTQGSFNIVVQSEVAERIGPQVKVEGVPASRTLAIVAAAYGLCLKLGDEQIVKLLECPESDIAPATDVFEYWWTPPPPCVEDHTAT
jgi:hypothetical protein